VGWGRGSLGVFSNLNDSVILFVPVHNYLK